MLQEVSLRGERFFKIEEVDQMRPFFMSIVSHANHWLFVASNGGLTAGRRNADFALFPYYTDDKVTESAEVTGPRTIIRWGGKSDHLPWEPFSKRGEGRFTVHRNLYKSIYGNAVRFEEVNENLGLTFHYTWRTSDRYGFVRDACLTYTGADKLEVEVLDGLQNIVPHGVGSELQNRTSNLVDAYKRSELHRETGLGIYALSAIIVDKAEPSEALKANVVYALPSTSTLHLLSSMQLDNFRAGHDLEPELDIKGERGAYFTHRQLTLDPGETQCWQIVADVNQDQTAVVDLLHQLNEEASLIQAIKKDIDAGTDKLIKLAAASDGVQRTGDHLQDSRHFSNVLFNIMRGGIFDHNYDIERADFRSYLEKANRELSSRFSADLAALPEVFTLMELQAFVDERDDKDLRRLATEYLPLKFSRRHGDPSRPWNKFSINTQDEHGRKILDYEGNWRDIFQNWETLVHSYPAFIEGMVYKFLNATTFDGYNPYRVTKGGFDWETIEEDDPWSYIGYWGDHQIIYLLKLLEFWENHYPGNLLNQLGQRVFVYANVPYRIKPYAALLQDPKDTVLFDRAEDEAIRKLRTEHGADGALLRHTGEELHRITLMEKLLATTLAKVANLIPGGGIWMNTQRPEWNDANNALVGNGVSMVTLYYLRRFMTFYSDILDQAEANDYDLSTELSDYFSLALSALEQHATALTGAFSDRERKQVLDALGGAASEYRQRIYDGAFSGETAAVKVSDLRRFGQLVLRYCDHAIVANQRNDGLYHAYNLLSIDGEKVSIEHLDEMLEGQVAVLSAKYLTAEQSLRLLDALRASDLYREDQSSYILYPDKDLPGFLDKNNIPENALNHSPLLQRMVASGDRRIVSRDRNGDIHFNGDFTNVKDLRSVLRVDEFADVSEAEKQAIENIFEQVFNHKAFTGRSGTFFGYEGLGSIYWHMVSKLRLAVMEICQQAVASGVEEDVLNRLLVHYYAIAEGTGVHKDPTRYGAFPTDPYSHTPAGRGAQQPGMTGQVKEDILCRFGELGVSVQGARLRLDPRFVRAEELTGEQVKGDFIQVDGSTMTIEVPANGLAFTYCQVPICYRWGDEGSGYIQLADGSTQEVFAGAMSTELSSEIFNRTGCVKKIEVTLTSQKLR